MNYYQVKLIKNLSALNKFFLWLAIIWTGIVTYFCMIDSDDIPVLPNNFDKLGHISFHFGITTLWFLYFNYRKSNNQIIRKALLKAFLFSFTYGIIIEICQGVLTDSRTADIFDVMANTIGASLAVITILFITRTRKKE